MYSKNRIKASLDMIAPTAKTKHAIEIQKEYLANRFQSK
jgi:hypothetical protein